LIPEDLVPVQNIGTLTLNRNPVDYFTEVEQVAFCTQHIVPGMDFSSDPLLAGRNFSYQDTQITRLGVNFADIPVNRPVCPFATNQRDGALNMFSKTNRAPYHPNRFDALPTTAPEHGGFHSYPEKMEGVKARVHGAKFNEYVNQATLFYNSMSAPEKAHMVAAAQFELTKCYEHEVQQAAIERFNLIDHSFAEAVAEAMPRVKVPDAVKPNHGQKSDYLSQVTGKTQVFTAAGRKAAIYVLPGFDYSQVAPLKKALEAASMIVKIVGPGTGPVKAAGGETLEAEFTFENSRSTHFDCLLFAGGPGDYPKQLKNGRLIHAVREAYMHLKTIGATGNAVPWVTDICLPGDFTDNVKNGDSVQQENGVVFASSLGTGAEFAAAFLGGVAQHRVWDREVSHIAA